MIHIDSTYRVAILYSGLLERKIEERRSRGRPRTMWIGNITEWSGYGYVEATRKAQDMNYWWQLIASDPAMDETMLYVYTYCTTVFDQITYTKFGSTQHKYNIPSIGSYNYWYRPNSSTKHQRAGLPTQILTTGISL